MSLLTQTNPQFSIETAPDLESYDTIIIAYSGGKDSTACALFLQALGVDMSKVELWHHSIDGREGSTLMDWPVTGSYCQTFADYMNLELYYSWRAGGFERELLRENQRTAPVYFESPDGLQTAGGIHGKPNTRRKFPQQSANLGVRWCSGALKIDVMSAAINNQSRFLKKKTLVITGERAEESVARKNYAVFERHRTDRRNGTRVIRWVDHWRPIHRWTETEVWRLIERFGIVPHPAYRIGWGRLSCAGCIFGSDAQWASLAKVNPEQFAGISGYEDAFDMTIDRNQRRLSERIQQASSYDQMREEDIAQAVARKYTQPIYTRHWELPMGAFGDAAGPT